VLFIARCPVCGRAGASPCAGCVARLVPALGSAVPCLFLYVGVGRTLVVALKYRNGRGLVAWLARGLAGLVPPGSVDVVTWAPTHATRRRRRGYDQAEVLARATAARLGVPCRSLLRRTDRAGPQTGRARQDRLVGPAFQARRRVRGRVLLVDDVMTTGATLDAAIRALDEAGADVVVPIAAAATPRPGDALVAPTLCSRVGKG
jgi:predicted amidophosphoribosyltransferase